MWHGTATSKGPLALKRMQYAAAARSEDMPDTLTQLARNKPATPQALRLEIFASADDRLLSMPMNPTLA
jgi:hypothetical protein